MAQVTDNIIGVDFTDVWTAGAVDEFPPFKTGTTVNGEGGLTYVYAKASETIGASVTVADITLSSGEYVAAASGGGYSNASGVALAANDHAWFSA